jgi:Hypothetical protein (DUF2513).
MKLDNDLVRLMLLEVEEIVDGSICYEINSFCEVHFPDTDFSKTRYHMKYLIDAGYVESIRGFFVDITPTGRDFLNNVRDNQVWATTKETIKPLGTVALNVVSEVAATIVKKTFNLS